MSAKGDIAVELFHKGFNCAQSVAGAFCDELGLDFESAVKLVSGFGGGFGRMREVCGAVSGGVMVLSSVFGYSDTSDPEAKKREYAIIQNFMNAFREKTGSYICKELLEGGFNSGHAPEETSERTEEYYEKRPCSDLTRISAELVEEIIRDTAE